jgi:hypothetical protein
MNIFVVSYQKSRNKIAAKGCAADTQRVAIRGLGATATSEQKQSGRHSALLATRCDTLENPVIMHV